MKQRAAAIIVIVILVCLSATACGRTGKQTKLQVIAKPGAPLEATTPAKWQPKRDTEGQLAVQIVPANAKIDLASLGEKDGILPVKVKVLDFGHNNGNPNNRKENYNAQLRLDRPRFISQVFIVTESNREVTQELVRVSFESAKISQSFERAAQAYRMSVAYPTYIPWGYELEMNEFHAEGEETGEMPKGTWYLIWTRGISSAEWPDGTSSITMRFSPSVGGPVLSGQAITPPIGEPEKFRTIKIDDQLNARLSKQRAIFLVNDLVVGEILFQDISAAEAKKIVKGMRFVEYLKEP